MLKADRRQLPMLSDSIILKHIARQPKRAAGFKQLVRELGLHGAERNALDGLLRKLVSSGALIQDDSDRYALPQAGPSSSSGLDGRIHPKPECWQEGPHT